MGSSRQQTWCHKTLKAKKNHYSGNFLLLRPGGKRCKPQSSYIQQKNQSLPAKCWVQSRQRSESGSEASSKKFQGLLLKSFEFNSCYSEQVVSKNQSSTEKQHVIYICYMRINCSDLNSIFQFFLRQTCLMQWLWSIFSHVAHAVHKFDEFCLRHLIFPA